MRFNPTIGQRTTFAFSMMILLVLAASGTALIYSHVTESNIVRIRHGDELINDASDLKNKWLGVVASVDHMLVTRQSSLIEYKLNGQLDAFQNALKLFIGKSGLVDDSAVKAYASAVDRMHSQSTELDEIIHTFKFASSHGEWAKAQIIRHLELASLQRRFEDDLGFCTKAIEASVNVLMAESVQHQKQIWSAVVSVTALAVILAITAGILSIVHISRPINTLARIARAIRDGDLSRRADISGHGEIGDLADDFNAMTEKLGQTLLDLGDSEERFRKMMESLPIAIALSDLDGNITYINTKFKDSFGYALEEISTLDGWWPRAYPDKDYREKVSADWIKAVEEAAATGEDIKVQEWTVTCADGSHREIEFRHTPIGVTGVTTMVDITEHKRAQREIRASEERFRQLSDAGWEAIIIHDHGKVLQVNQQFYDMFGYSESEIIGKQAYATIVAPESLKMIRDRVDEGDLSPYEAVGLKKNGDRIDMEIRARTLDFHGRDTRMAAIRDVTEKKRSERELAETKALFESVMEQSPIPMAVASYPDMILRVVNPACQEQLGIEDEPPLVGMELLKMRQTWKDYTLEGDLIPVDELPLAKALAGEISDKVEIKAVRKDGSERWHYVSGAPIFNDQGELIAGHIAFPDITDRKRAEQELLALRNYLENIVDSMPSVLVGVDADGIITQWNRAATEATGLTFDDAQGRLLTDALPEMALEIERIKEAIKTRSTWEDSKRSRMVDGEELYEDVTIYPLIANGVTGAVIRVDDITPRVRIEEMMIQTEKMMSVGGLAAGMAHEINNPLGIILASTKNITKRLSANGKKNRQVAEECGIDLTKLETYIGKRGIADNFDWIQQAGARAAHIVSNMLDFSRKSDAEMEKQAINALLDTTVDLVFNDFSIRDFYDITRINFVRDYEDNLPEIQMFRVEIEQVLLNLLKNSIQALAEMGDDQPDPRITLKTGQAGGYVFVEIGDNGPGMDEETRKRVFEPFYTTKEIGVGTGLGLSVSFFIVTKNHNGEFQVESEPGKGSRFTIVLPTNS